MPVTVNPLVIEDLTFLDIQDPGALTGAGAFDKIMVSVMTHLNKERTSGNITGKDYAVLYGQALSDVLQQSVQFELQKDKAYLENLLINANIAKVENEVLKTLADTEYIKAKTVGETIKNGTLSAPNSLYGKNIAAVQAQKDLYDRQAEGFDDNKTQKALDSAINAWSLVFEENNTIGTPYAVLSANNAAGAAGAKLDYGLDELFKAASGLCPVDAENGTTPGTVNPAPCATQPVP